MKCAPIACAQCAQKKRKCDRLLPACSRCSSSRTSEPCRYNDPSQPNGTSGPGIALAYQQRPKADMACTQCRTQKRACNRGLPSCSRCELQYKTCIYDAVPAHKLKVKSPFSKAKAHLRTLYGPEIRTSYPVRDSKYIPALIHHFCSVLVIPATAALPNSLARHVQSTWMLSALGDPCLFHATVFSASAHMDGLLGISNNPRTIYHQLQAVQLLRKRLIRPHFRVNYETIGAVLGLGYFDIVIGNVDGVKAHNQGLMQMLATKHDQGPETEALMGLANMTHFTLSMVSNTDCLFLPHPTMPSEGASAQPLHPLANISPSSLLSRVLARAAAGTNILAPPMLTLDTVLDLVSTARKVVSQQEDTGRTTHEFLGEETTRIDLLGAEALTRASFFPSFGSQTPKLQYMNKCVLLASRICRNLLRLPMRNTRAREAAVSPSLSVSPSPPQTTIETAATVLAVTPIQTSSISPIAGVTLPTSSTSTSTNTTTTKPTPHLFRDDIAALKSTLPKIDFVSWLQHAPEAYVWVCFTAAAAAVACRRDAGSDDPRHSRKGNDDNSNASAEEGDEWASFILTPMPVITAMDSAELRVMREGWAYLRWLRGLAGS
ncbi:hypothetical protein BJX64DRAFT_271079 [Aspergillus heterothallicus]